MNFQELVDKIKMNFPEVVIQQENIVSISKESLLPLVQFLKDSEDFYFDQLACMTGFDTGNEENRFEVIYNFYSIPLEHKLAISVRISNDSIEIPSLCVLYKAADWQEREVFDLFGIKFQNHPDLRRILLPANWEGYPLRKDYKTQEFYHGIKVDY